MNYTPPPAGTVRGPFESSPGNPQRYQACYRTVRGSWSYAFAGTPFEALRQARAAAAEHLRLTAANQPT